MRVVQRDLLLKIQFTQGAVSASTHEPYLMTSREEMKSIPYNIRGIPDIHTFNRHLKPYFLTGILYAGLVPPMFYFLPMLRVCNTLLDSFMYCN